MYKQYIQFNKEPTLMQNLMSNTDPLSNTKPLYIIQNIILNKASGAVPNPDIIVQQDPNTDP